jgi:undecaprenyl diphosphate synthase
MMSLPRHIAIVMDGNGRWAEARKRPRTMGHNAGVKATRKVVRACAELGVGTLTLFAFSSENWHRPKNEVRRLLDLFLSALNKEIDELHGKNVCLRFVGERTVFSAELQAGMRRAEKLTAENNGMNLAIAVNYGGRWDYVQAARAMAREVSEGRLNPGSIDEECVNSHFSLAGLPDPDLLIRTGGEKRISNFLLWQLAYTEFYFTDVLWPDFDREELEKAIADFGLRHRRFGMTGEQMDKARHA